MEPGRKRGCTFESTDGTVAAWGEDTFGKVEIGGVRYAMISSNTNRVYAVAQNEVGFADVQKHWSLPFVELVAAKGLVEGVGVGKYDPNKAVTRAELTAMLVRALGRGATNDGKAPYDDVKQGAWYFGEVAAAKELGLLDFAGGDSFKPDQPLTREEMASMLAGVLALEKGPTAKGAARLDGFKDIESADAA
jgi:S-layer homology domain.